LGIVLAAAIQLTGINAIIYYAPQFFAGAICSYSSTLIVMVCFVRFLLFLLFFVFAFCLTGVPI
jgi:hypothetical protein